MFVAGGCERPGAWPVDEVLSRHLVEVRAGVSAGEESAPALILETEGHRAAERRLSDPALAGKGEKAFGSGRIGAVLKAGPRKYNADMPTDATWRDDLHQGRM
jgi:hypothetical protein